MAQGSSHHPAPRIDYAGTAERGCERYRPAEFPGLANPARPGAPIGRNKGKGPRGGALTMPCIEARGLRKVFGSTVALDNVDLRVEEGRILGLIGPNGAGKTTALNAILGLTPYQGELKVLGRDPWR